jgi:hypothetical protein
MQTFEAIRVERRKKNFLRDCVTFDMDESLKIINHGFGYHHRKGRWAAAAAGVRLTY